MSTFTKKFPCFPNYAPMPAQLVFMFDPELNGEGQPIFCLLSLEFDDGGAIILGEITVEQVYDLFKARQSVDFVSDSDGVEWTLLPSDKQANVFHVIQFTRRYNAHLNFDEILEGFNVCSNITK